MENRRSKVNEKFNIEIQGSDVILYGLMLQDQIKILIDMEFTSLMSEFEYVKKILFAFYGWKWNAFRGWFKTKPYHEYPETVTQLKNFLSLSKERRFTVAPRIKLMCKIYSKLCEQSCEESFLELNDIARLELEQWNGIIVILKNFSIDLTVVEAKTTLLSITHQYL